MFFNFWIPNKDESNSKNKKGKNKNSKKKEEEIDKNNDEENERIRKDKEEQEWTKNLINRVNMLSGKFYPNNMMNYSQYNYQYNPNQMNLYQNNFNQEISKNNNQTK